MSHLIEQSLKEGLSSLKEMEMDYLESSKRRVTTMSQAERREAAEEYRTRAALYFELYRTAMEVEVV